jgi:2-keto-4-pentenoate hydratase/2-oxohepta-3-ene-1,7-dioic acid hydratase in catechol pathway
LRDGVVDVRAWAGSSDLPASVDAYLAASTEVREAVADAAAAIAYEVSIEGHSSFSRFESIEFLPTVRHPGKVLAAGRNYEDHRAEAASAGLATNPDADDAVPTGFIKSSSTLTGHLQPIVVPDWIEDVDYEAELVIVIGRDAQNVSEANALDCVAGFTVGNDVSARKLQHSEHRSGGGPLVGKNPKTFGPIGPHLVTIDEVEDPMRQRVWCRVNGEARQDAFTTDMRFDIRSLISWFSKVGLDAGDLIFTGTPAGIGASGKGFLAPGDVVTCGVDGIGVLQNPVTRGSWAQASVR